MFVLEKNPYLIGMIVFVELITCKLSTCWRNLIYIETLFRDQCTRCEILITANLASFFIFPISIKQVVSLHSSSYTELKESQNLFQV